MDEKVLRYEQFLNETLKGDLETILHERDKVYSEIAEYLQLKTVIENLMDEGVPKSGLKTKVDLGCNFYVQAKVPDASKIFVQVGFGFFVELTFNEALKFIEKKVTHLNTVSDGLSKDANKVKAHIKIVIEGLREIQGIDDRPEQQPQRDIFS